MSGTLTLHSSHEGFGAFFQSVAGALGVTPGQLFHGEVPAPVNMLAPVTLVQSVAQQGNQFVVGLLGGSTFRLTLENTTVTHTSLEFGGQMLYSWQGQLDFNRFLSGDWVPDVVNGSAGADWLGNEDGRSMNGGGGNDFFDIVLEAAFGATPPSITAAGGAGVDNFMLVGNRGNLTLTDYQRGEKIIFADYANLDALLRDVRGVQETANGFVVQFSSENSFSPRPGAWSLTFQNFTLAQLDGADLLFNSNVAEVTAIVAPLVGSYGLTMADFMS